uniref:RNA-directed DNA polymerase, eukaryota, reverse transcriptase zinc-binding domain protein n=1 Tax=Tanacetum cinerariifolium TaxID=118510 RepID=A0A6L2JZY1_TANCI|nr:RNA-directed DNA polymerase, eukaryota, reverse transcriptase zinc-binding domain protein [Tanacetum cinerariifolium]
MKVLQNMEYIRARFFNGADVNSKKPRWVRWKSVLAAKDVGGLGVSSLFALNRTLVFKWVWRFFSQKNSLWLEWLKHCMVGMRKLVRRSNIASSSWTFDVPVSGSDLCMWWLDGVSRIKNFVRRFLRALHPKWRANVTTIEESKDLSSISLDELIGNIKVHEVVTEKDSQLVGDKREKVKSRLKN